MQNNNSPIVSICVPVYGVEKYIEKCARSLFEQTYQNIEYVFVDDCGLDKSISILEIIISDYPNRKNAVRIIRHERNRGLAAARNTAVDVAKGDFIMHVDSDDWLELDAVEILAKKQLETGADIVSGAMMLDYSDSTYLVPEPDYCDKKAFLLGSIQANVSHHTLCKRIIRTSIYRKNNIKEIEGVNVGEDYQTFPRLVYYIQSFAKVENVIYHYNQMNQDSYMAISFQQVNPTHYRSNVASIDILINFFKGKNHTAVFRLLRTRLGYVHKVNVKIKNTDNAAFSKEVHKDLMKSVIKCPYYYLKILLYQVISSCPLYNKIKKKD